MICEFYRITITWKTTITDARGKRYAVPSGSESRASILEAILSLEITTTCAAWQAKETNGMWHAGDRIHVRLATMHYPWLDSRWRVL